MRIEFSGASVEIEEYQTEDFMRCAEAAFVAAGYMRGTFVEMVRDWLEEEEIGRTMSGMEEE